MFVVVVNDLPHPTTYRHEFSTKNGLRIPLLNRQSKFLQVARTNQYLKSEACMVDELKLFVNNPFV